MSHHVAILSQQSGRLFVVLAVRLLTRGIVNYIPRNVYGIIIGLYLSSPSDLANLGEVLVWVHKYIIPQVIMEEQQQPHQFIQVVVTQSREDRLYLD